MSEREKVTPARRMTALVHALESRVFLAGDAAAAVTDSAPAASGGADLTVRFTRPVRGSFVGGDAGRASVEVANSGSGIVADARPVALYLSGDESLDAADRLIATVPLGKSLRPGRAARVKFAFDFPSDLPSGGYRVLARADDANADPGVPEANTVAVGGTIAYTAPVVDIVPLVLRTAKVRSWRGLPLEGWAIFVVRNSGNRVFRGPITGNIHTQLVGPFGEFPSNLFRTYSEEVVIKRGATKRIKVTFDSPRDGPSIFILTAAGPGDVTPDQSVSARAKYRSFRWGE